MNIVAVDSSNNKGVCTSIITVKDTINRVKNETINICEGDSTLIGNVYVKESGEFYNRYENAYGCSHSEFIKVQVHEYPEITIDTSEIRIYSRDLGYVYLPEAKPDGGKYYGKGVRGNVVNLELADIGKNIIYYEYIGYGGCKSYDSTYIVVVENTDSDLLVVYPNPSKGIFYVLSKYEFEYELYDAAGKLLKYGESRTTFFKLNLTTYAKAVYLLKITTPRGIFTKKLIVI